MYHRGTSLIFLGTGQAQIKLLRISKSSYSYFRWGHAGEEESLFGRRVADRLDPSISVVPFKKGAREDP
jgi:hypothetical protein